MEIDQFIGHCPGACYLTIQGDDGRFGEPIHAVVPVGLDPEFHPPERKRVVLEKGLRRNGHPFDDQQGYYIIACSAMQREAGNDHNARCAQMYRNSHCFEAIGPSNSFVFPDLRAGVIVPGIAVNLPECLVARWNRSLPNNVVMLDGTIGELKESLPFQLRELGAGNSEP